MDLPSRATDEKEVAAISLTEPLEEERFPEHATSQTSTPKTESIPPETDQVTTTLPTRNRTRTPVTDTTPEGTKGTDNYLNSV
jgi:hypothetical protein